MYYTAVISDIALISIKTNLGFFLYIYIYIYIYMSDDINKQSAHDTEYVVVFFSYISDI